MEYVIIDLEWNQASRRDQEISGLPFEIIEIGAVKMSEDGVIVDEFDRLIRPVVYPELYFRIREVVHMSTRMLEKKGQPFETVVRDFFEWCGKDVAFCTWGSMDLTEFQRNIQYFGLENPFPSPLFYYDIQKLYSLEYEDGKARSALETAVDVMGLYMGEPFHRAVSDAYYTGLVMGAIGMKKYQKQVSVDYFRIPATREDEIYLVFDDYSKFVSRAFPTREEAMQDKDVTSMVCYRCGMNVRRRINWFADSGKHYYALAYCPHHGWLKGKIRTKKDISSDNVFMVKTLKLVSSEKAAKVVGRQKALKEKRRHRRGQGR